MKKENCLTFRVLLLAVGALFLNLFLLLACAAFAVSAGAPVWPVPVAGAALLLLLWLAVSRVIRPYRRLERTLQLVLEGYNTTELSELTEVTLTPATAALVRRMLGLMDSSQLLKMNKRQAQYLALQNQINPHFLYNTLESIRSEALTAGLRRVADMTEALASFFRYTISKVENLVSVEEELQNCETYFHIQKYRFGDRLSLSVEYDPADREEILRCRLPKLTLQPILENSIIHGTECKIGSGHLTIRLELGEKRLLIRISDDGVGMDEQKLAAMNERLEKSGREFSAQESGEKGGIALVNVNNRIHLLFGEEYGLHVFSMPGIGTDVEISLPAITSDRELERSGAAERLRTEEAGTGALLHESAGG